MIKVTITDLDTGSIIREITGNAVCGAVVDVDGEEGNQVSIMAGHGKPADILACTGVTLGTIIKSLLPDEAVRLKAAALVQISVLRGAEGQDVEVTEELKNIAAIKKEEEP